MESTMPRDVLMEFQDVENLKHRYHASVVEVSVESLHALIRELRETREQRDSLQERGTEMELELQRLRANDLNAYFRERA